MSYLDYSSHWQLDQFLTFLEANQLGSNDKQIVDNFSTEHTWNAVTADGTHKSGIISGSSINTTPASTGSQAIPNGGTWTPAAGIYQMTNAFNEFSFDMYISGAWRAIRDTGFNGVVETGVGFTGGLHFCDGSNMRIYANGATLGGSTVYYQKF